MLANELWYELFDFTHLEYVSESLSDHTPLVLTFPHCPRQRSPFRFLKDLKTPLRKLNKDKFSDIHQQQEIHRAKLLQIQNALHRDPQNKELQQREETNWSTRSLLYAGRLALVNTVVIGVYKFWTSIFMLPKKVTQHITKLCGDYIWGATEERRRQALEMCVPKKNGGLGVKNLEVWNQACATKLVWAIAMKKNLLWVRWIHGRYLRDQQCWDFKAPRDAYWYLKKLCGVKNQFK
ncbi:hypothetical protein Cgig2_013291 [Carnegiea gigantea]|uniref:Reverse transcriptase n=1 Tax=Carnegiea gigantea TaxID=171969 RepID=A0A9Q1GHM6_9CARY|nr:hypothetical protein Cgig2_013291 [Carnegiea gigantea]